MSNNYGEFYKFAISNIELIEAPSWITSSHIALAGQILYCHTDLWVYKKGSNLTINSSKQKVSVTWRTEVFVISARSQLTYLLSTGKSLPSPAEL